MAEPEQSWLDRYSPTARQFLRVPVAMGTFLPTIPVAGARLAYKETLSRLPESVQQWAKHQAWLPTGDKFTSPTAEAASRYRENIEKRYWSDEPFISKAQQSAQDLLGGLWSMGETAIGWHDYPGDDKPVRFTPRGLWDEARNFAAGRLAATENLGASAVGVPASMAAGLASDVASGQNRVLSGDPVGVSATLAPVAARAFRAGRGRLGGPEVEARSLGQEPLTTPLNEPTRSYQKPGWSRSTGLPPEPMEQAMAARLLPVARQFVRQGLVSAQAAADALERVVPFRAVLDSQAAQSAGNAAVRMGKGAVAGMAVGGDALGPVPAAAIGALAPEAVRMFWRALDPEHQAAIVRKVGGRGARYQQPTEEETQFAKQVIETDHSMSEGMGALGQSAAGEYLRSQPQPAHSLGMVPAPTVYRRPKDVRVTPTGDVEIVPRERIVQDAVAAAQELGERRAEAQGIPELRRQVAPSDPTQTANMAAVDALDAMEEQAAARKRQIGNTQGTFDEGRYDVRGPGRSLPHSTTSPAFNLQAAEMQRLGSAMPPSEVAPHWWRMAAIEPVVDPQSPKFLRSARMRGALVKKLTAGMDKKTAAAAAKVLDKDLAALAEESIGPRPLVPEYRLPDGRIVDMGQLLDEVRLDPAYANPAKPGQRSAYQEMVAETIGETHKAYGIKAGEVAALKHLELEGSRVGDMLGRDNADLFGQHVAQGILNGRMLPQVAHANPVLAGERIASNPAAFGLTPEQGAAVAKTLREQYIPTPEVVKKFMQRGAEQGIIEHGAALYMKRGFAEALNEHLSVNYAKDILSASERKITLWGRMAKEALTALSVSTKLANDTSNRVMQWVSRGIDPATYERQLRHAEARWKALSEGAPATDYELQRHRSLLKTGKLDTDMLAVEGKRTEHFGPTSGTPVQKARRVMRQAYAKSDALPKLEEAIANYDYMFNALGKLGDGQKVVMEVGPNTMAHLSREGGVLKLNGKSITPEALSDLVARNAVQSALRKFVDHGDVNVLVSALRRGSAVGVITPFLTWSWGVKDVPGIKSGALGAIMFNDGPLWATTDPALQRMQWERAVKTSVRRGAMTGAAWASLDEHGNEPWERVFGRAPTPAVRQIAGDPLTDDVIDLARYDFTAPSIALWRLGAKAAWALKGGIDAASQGMFPGTVEAKLGTFKQADPKVLRAWSHFETGKGTEQDALDLIGFGGGILAPALREYFKPGGEGNWQPAAWALSRAVVGGTPSDVVNSTLAAFLPKASSRKLERPGKWTEDPATGEVEGPVRWEPWLNFTLKKAIGLGFRTVNSLDQANAFLERAEKEAEKKWVKPLADDVAMATADLARATKAHGAMSEQATKAAAEVQRLAAAQAMAQKAVTLTVAGYRKQLARFIKERMDAPKGAAAAEIDADAIEDEVRSLGGGEPAAPSPAAEP